ncbi:cAMP-dependent protein kinase catalytic subunit [Dipsacomyces acuminosporus]|nr:cAMP-dependent protein kinase catalytic subunit [Dipsacomyces acuminosporus]
MAFINKILQKTKTKISDKDSSSHGYSAPSEKPAYRSEIQLTSTTPVSIPDTASDSQIHTVPSNLTQPHLISQHQQHQYQQHQQPQQTYATLPLPKHLVPSNAASYQVPSSTSVAVRAASFSVGALSVASKNIASSGGVYVPSQNAIQQQQQQQQQQHALGTTATAAAQAATVGTAGANDYLQQHIQHHHHHHHHQQQQQQQLQMVQPAAATAQCTERSYEDTHVKLDDFEVFRTVGTGSFGRVRLVRHKATNKHYAMKVLKKSHVVKAKQVEHVNSERKILAECDCPFIVHMLGTCQDNVNLYFFMEYVVGGELFTYLRRYHRFPPPVAKFYAAEVLLALEYLHSKHIIWRDTKPENILLDHRGHVKLTDMGFAKKVTDRTWTLCGTPDYLAPEVIQAKGYGKSVDWWALGILIFEMIAGYPPFYDEDHYRLYEKILSGRVQWPAQFDPVARDLVSRLLTADLSRRLGNLHRGSADIKEHRWFAEVDWNRLAAREIPAPLIPPQKVDGDTSNFDKYPETTEKYGDMTTPDPYADLFLDF